MEVTSDRQPPVAVDAQEVPEVGLPWDVSNVADLNCVSIDLEVGKKDGRIHKIGAVRSKSGSSLKGGGSANDVKELDVFASGADFVLGHNVIAFDLPKLAESDPRLKLLTLPVVDTLWLSPLAFPRHPYHNLVKHYQDGGIRRRSINDPELDSRLALELFDDERVALRETHGRAPDLVTAWHWLTTLRRPTSDALDDLFTDIRQAATPTDSAGLAAVCSCLKNDTCDTQSREIRKTAKSHAWSLAYALAWLSVAGSNSVMPPWVRHQFPDAGKLVRRLRDTACTSPDCTWCREHHNPCKVLLRWFGFPGFQAKPSNDDGYSLQATIVEQTMARQHVLGIMPTGSGKSVCYQVPALSRYEKTGSLTVVISPLVALMEDQVRGLERKGIECCTTVNAMLSGPERQEALDRVRLGDAGILIISPEQLRSRTMRRTLEQREIGGWVLDEAHCLSRWGHDFRPDYRYVSRVIRELAGDQPTPPVLCLTATAKPDVRDEITEHFRDKLAIDLTIIDGGAERTNLEFEVIATSNAYKLGDIHAMLDARLPPESGGAIVYCATRRQSEEVAEFLQARDVSAEYFHAGLEPTLKREVQSRFVGGELRVIAATNAFGMGIDKPDVRLVIHAEIPGSLENYLQEAGRAGRDGQSASCVLLFAEGDVERQFKLSARSHLSSREIHGILKALRRLDRSRQSKARQADPNDDVVATPGEILLEDEDNSFERDRATNDTRVRTAVAWLEESDLLQREENFVQVFPSSLQLTSLLDIDKRLLASRLQPDYRKKLLTIAAALVQADADDGISTDELMSTAGLGPRGIRKALHDLEQLGIARNDTALTAYVRSGVANSSNKRFEQADELENALIGYLQETAPDLNKGDMSELNLTIAAQVLRDSEVQDAPPDRIMRILRGISNDGRETDDPTGSIALRKLDPARVRVTMQRGWRALAETAKRRRTAARLLLDHFLSTLPPGLRGRDLLAETTEGKLLAALKADMHLWGKLKEPDKLLRYALLWLHDLDVIRLHKGLFVFRPAMSIRLDRESRRGFSKTDYQPLKFHYQGQIVQVHVMAEFAKRGIEATADALRLAMDYFTLNEADFLARWLPEQDRNKSLPTTRESWEKIVANLSHRQRQIVADDREESNVLVLAGPGSGKTRVLVHRIAYLIRVRREKPRSILALAYNRHAAVDIKRRLRDLIGDDAFGVTTLTCHALAMRLAGFSFEARTRQAHSDEFDEIIDRATSLLRGDDTPDEADAMRDRLLAGFRWILVDEYQDINERQYALVSALAGRTLNAESSRLSLFAVGDDDQNIYAFNGTSVEFIRRFQADYSAKPSYLTENYRSSRHIIDAANAVVDRCRDRMKADHPIQVDRHRKKAVPGGEWAAIDLVAQGRVQVLHTEPDPVRQGLVVMGELCRLGRLTDWDWSRCAVLAREWDYLAPIHAICKARDIPVQMAHEDSLSLWRVRETRTLVTWLRELPNRSVDPQSMQEWLLAQRESHWNDLLRQAIDEYQQEAQSDETDEDESRAGGALIPVDPFVEWLAEWSQGVRQRQHGLLLATAHRAKGLEFDHVAVLDGGWGKRAMDPDEQRRLFYVAMTRARATLLLATFEQHRFIEPLAGLQAVHWVQHSLALTPRAADRLKHVRPGLGDVDLGFAGRRPQRDPVHARIGSLSTGDQLKIEQRKGKWQVVAPSGPVGRLAAKFTPPAGYRCKSARVRGVIRWSRELSGTEYRDHAKCDEWEVVIPEFVFEPASPATTDTLVDDGN